MSWIDCDYLVVIVNYGTPGDVTECLASLQDEVAAMGTTQVMVVDNRSPDDSFRAIGDFIEANRMQSWAKVVLAPSNGGFSAGNNVAIREALQTAKPPQFFHLLNPDTLIEPGALREVKRFMQTQPKVGIVGSRQTTPAGDWNKAFRFPGVFSEFDRGAQFGFVSNCLQRFRVAMVMGEHSAKVEWVSGASMVVRKQVFDDIGLMDERFFLYYEETDFCINAARAGWECWHLPASVVFHKVGTSTGVTKTEVPKRLPSYVFESKNYYFRKNHGYVYAITANLAFVLGLMLNRVLAYLPGRSATLTPYILRDSLRHLGARRTGD